MKGGGCGLFLLKTVGPVVSSFSLTASRVVGFSLHLRVAPSGIHGGQGHSFSLMVIPVSESWRGSVEPNSLLVVPQEPDREAGVR